MNERDLILSTKKELNWSADSVEEGSDADELERWQIWLIKCQRDLKSEQFLNRDEK